MLDLIVWGFAGLGVIFGFFFILGWAEEYNKRHPSLPSGQTTPTPELEDPVSSWEEEARRTAKSAGLNCTCDYRTKSAGEFAKDIMAARQREQVQGLTKREEVSDKVRIPRKGCPIHMWEEIK